MKLDEIEWNSPGEAATDRRYFDAFNGSLAIHHSVLLVCCDTRKQ